MSLSGTTRHVELTLTASKETSKDPERKSSVKDRAGCYRASHGARASRSESTAGRTRVYPEAGGPSLCRVAERGSALGQSQAAPHFKIRGFRTTERPARKSESEKEKARCIQEDSFSREYQHERLRGCIPASGRLQLTASFDATAGPVRSTIWNFA